MQCNFHNFTKRFLDFDVKLQELRALALLQIIGSFFTCHPACSSISRAAVISQTGVNSQVYSNFVMFEGGTDRIEVTVVED